MTGQPVNTRTNEWADTDKSVKGVGGGGGVGWGWRVKSYVDQSWSNVINLEYGSKLLLESTRENYRVIKI